MFLPLQFGAGAVPLEASPELIALVQLFGGPFLGIAVLNWQVRNIGPSAAVRPVLIANIVGFVTVTANDIWGVTSGEAREIATVFLVVHLAFAIVFIVAVQRDYGRHCCRNS